MQTYDGEKTRKQIPEGIFLKRLAAPQEELQASASGGFPEEDIVIIGDDRSVPAIAPKELLVGHDVEVGDSDIGGPDPI